MILVENRVLHLYEEHNNDQMLETLRLGVLLLHSISQNNEQHFQENRCTVEHHYVRVVCRLTSLFKNWTTEYDQECEYIVVFHSPILSSQIDLSSIGL